MILILRTLSLSYPDWLPAAGLALLIFIAILSIAASIQKRAEKSKYARMMLILIGGLAYIGVFALLRMVM